MFIILDILLALDGQRDWQTDGQTDRVGQTTSRSACITCWQARKTTLWILY